MFCHLNYQIDKKYFREYFWENFDKGQYHVSYDENGQVKTIHQFWWMLFGLEKITKDIMYDLGIIDMNVLPRFSFIKSTCGLKPHVDIDRIVGINFNIMENNVPELTFGDHTVYYDSLLADVGSTIHQVKPVNYNRLILKFAIREPYQDVMESLDKRNLIDYEKTKIDNPHYAEYVSVLEEK